MRLPFTGHRIANRSIFWGAVGAAGMTAFYVTILAVAAGSRHLMEQASADWLWLALIIPGFGIQVALLTELRSHSRAGLASAGVGSASSAAGMVACCAHHLAELLPMLGLAGFAGFLVDWKTWLLSVGVIITFAMVTRAWWHLARIGRREEALCHTA